MGGLNPWLASFTRRWHTNPDLCSTVDPVGYHGGRMAILAIHCFPHDYSKELLAACVTHDLGEAVGGDVPFDAKSHVGIRDAHKEVEDSAISRMLPMFDADVDAECAERLKFLDRLDAYLWARHYTPHVMTRDDWHEQGNWLYAKAIDLGADIGILGL